jgi:hypothetical protein
MVTSITVGPAITIGSVMPISRAMAGPVTAGNQNVAPQPISWVSESAATARRVGEGRSIEGLQWNGGNVEGGTLAGFCDIRLNGGFDFRRYISVHGEIAGSPAHQ